MKQSKPIGTTNIEEIKNLSTAIPWEPVTTSKIPFSPITPPHGFLFAHGSACASLATTSREGWTYVADSYLYRTDGRVVDRDRYLGSLTPDGEIAILLVPKNKTPFHHVTPTTPLDNLPKTYQEKIREILSRTSED